MFDDDCIFDKYDPSNPVHNPAGYMKAKHEVLRDIERAAFEARKIKLADRPGQFAKVGYISWLVIVAMCMFVGWLLAK